MWCEWSTAEFISLSSLVLEQLSLWRPLRRPCWISSSECWCWPVFTCHLTAPSCQPNSSLLSSFTFLPLLDWGKGKSDSFFVFFVAILFLFVCCFCLFFFSDNSWLYLWFWFSVDLGKHSGSDISSCLKIRKKKLGKLLCYSSKLNRKHQKCGVQWIKIFVGVLSAELKQMLE